MGFRIPDLFTGYLRHDDINDYLNYLGETYPTLVSVIEEGQSFEGRPLKSIRISYDAAADDNCSATSVQKKRRSVSNMRENRSGLVKKKELKAAVATITTVPSQRRPVVLIDGGLHAREWMSVATALYCIYQLTERHLYNKELLKKLDFVIVPVVNVDGYEYTHTKVSL